MTQVIQDLSGNGNNGSFSDIDLVRTSNGLYFATDNSIAYCGGISLSSSITIEELVSLSLQSRISTIIDGPLSLKLIDRNYWEFSIGSSLYRAYLPVLDGEDMFIALSHTIGNGALTLLSINGKIANGTWVSGNGNDSVVGTANFSIKLGTGSHLKQLYISRRMKTIEEIRNYIGGSL